MTSRSLIFIPVLAASCGGGNATKLLSITPLDQAAHVAPGSTVTLTFSDALDPTSVNETNVRVFAATSDLAVPATVTYDDASHVVTLTPYAFLATRQLYTVKWSGLQDGGGAAVDDGSSTFWTITNGTKSSIRTDSTGVQTELDQYTVDANGDPLTGSDIIDPGPDGVWGTTDDPIALKVAVTTSADRSSEVATYTTTGPDLMWGTADDETACDAYAYGPFGGTLTMVSTPGADGVCATADDVYSEEIAYSYDSSGRLSLYLFIDAGADGKIGTADDSVTRHSGWQYDDPMATRSTTYAAGPDGVFNTADDVPSGYSVTQLDAHGVNQGYVVYDTAGPDGVWFTADDHASSCSAITHAADRSVSSYVYHSTGSDGIPYDTDDVETGYNTYTDADGAVSGVAAFNTPGADGIWGSSDDIASYAGTNYTTL